ncbi:hypothetical protein HK096_006613, partial [Nowakowskiella sp. JEL0078]
DLTDASTTNFTASNPSSTILQELARKTRSRSLAIPTDDIKVRLRLRELNEPQTLFGEVAADRRDRLRFVLSLEIAAARNDSDDDRMVVDSDDSDDSDDEEFFTRGDDELREARREIAVESLHKAKHRLMMHQEELALSIPFRKKLVHEWYNHLKTYVTFSSQFGDERPLSCVSFSPNSQSLAIGSWSGNIKLWGVPKCELLRTFKGHKDKVSDLAFAPRNQGTMDMSDDNSSTVGLASGDMAGIVNLWNLENVSPIARLEGHEARVAKVAFHPSGKFIGTTSFDKTWRLWDVNTEQQLLLQEGHSREVFALGFQCDGALVATAGMDAIGRIWDLRSGRSLMVFQGHVKPILTLDWSPNGYDVATAGEDNTIRVWDLRMGKCSYVVPAHKSLVTKVKYWDAQEEFDAVRYEGGDDMDESGSSEFKRQVLSGTHLVSCSHDGTTKIFTIGDWKPVRVLGGVDSKIMGCDVSG